MTIKVTTLIKLLILAGLIYNQYQLKEFEVQTRTGIVQMFNQMSAGR